MTYRTTGCLVRFCDRGASRTLHTIGLCDTHFGLGRKNGIDWLPLIQSARRKLDQIDHDCIYDQEAAL